MFYDCPYIDPKSAIAHVTELMAMAYLVTQDRVEILELIPVMREQISDKWLHVYRFDDWLACEFCPWQPDSFGALHFTSIHAYCARDYEREIASVLKRQAS
jgi:hypothetical protein